MEKKFTPLSIAPRNAGNSFGREFKATIIRDSKADTPEAGPQNAQPMVASQSASPMPAASTPHLGAAHGQPEVVLQRDGNRIVGIVVKCACGQVIELECSY